nr:sugar transferase [Bradyrhizobium zhengyangense]
MPPSEDIRERYAFFFREALQVDRWSKNLFDRSIGAVALIAALPAALVILMAHIVLSTLLESERGPILVGYDAVSQGRVFRKLKFRVVRQSHVDSLAAAAGDWRAYAGEWNPNCRSLLGCFLKQFYLDELPQLFNIALGQMSFVGPRPLAVDHYHRDLRQGNVHRKLLKAGLFGPSQALKGTTKYGAQDEEYKYLHAVAQMSAVGLLCYDIKLILRGLVTVAEGKGL